LAAQETWSLAPSLHLNVKALTPNASIVCYTSLHLREISLESRVDYLSVLKHLRDHCPNLRHLSITLYLLMTFPRFDMVLGSILERLIEFKVDNNDDSGADATERLLAVLSHCQRTPSILNLELNWRTHHLAPLKAVLMKLPSLTSFRMPLCRHEINLIDLFSDCKSLESVGGLPLAINQPWYLFLPLWVAGTSHTKIGINIKAAELQKNLAEFFGDANTDVPAVLVSCLERRQTLPVEILSDLATAGLKQPIKLDILTKLLRFCLMLHDTERFMGLLGFLLSNTPPAFFPQPQELIQYLVNSVEIWRLLVDLLPASAVQAVVKLIGAPQIHPTKLISSLLSKPTFDPDIMTMFEGMDIEDLSEHNLEEYFNDVSSTRAIKWLLNHFCRGKSPKILAESLPDGAWGSLMLNFFSCDRKRLVDACEDFFGDASNVLYSFPRNNDFAQFAWHCLTSADLKLFKRGVECTRLDKITPASLARVLAHFATFSGTEDNDEFLLFWLSTIKDGPEPDFTSPMLPEDPTDGKLVITDAMTAFRLLEFYPILLQFRDVILRQLRGLDASKQLIFELVEGIRYLKLSRFGNPSYVTYIQSYKSFLWDVIRLSSSDGHCPSAALINRLYFIDGTASTNIVSEAFSIAYQSDFSEENKVNRGKCVSEMMQQTVENYQLHENVANVASLVSLWIDHAKEESQLPRKPQLAAASGVMLGTILREDVSTCFSRDLEALIELLVRCGGRHDGPLNFSFLDPQAVEIYRDAVYQSVLR
jgi:hypothetical protein